MQAAAARDMCKGGNGEETAHSDSRPPSPHSISGVKSSAILDPHPSLSPSRSRYGGAARLGNLGEPPGARIYASGDGRGVASAGPRRPRGRE